MLLLSNRISSESAFDHALSHANARNNSVTCGINRVLSSRIVARIVLDLFSTINISGPVRSASKRTMQRGISIVNHSSQIITTSTLCVRASYRPTRIGLIGKFCSFFFISKKIKSIIKISNFAKSSHEIIQRNRSCGRFVFPSAIHTNCFFSSFIIIAMNENALRNIFINIAPVVPTAVTCIIVHFNVISFAISTDFINHRCSTLPYCVIRQEDIEILDIGLFKGNIKHARFFRIRMFLNPDITTIASLFKCSTAKAFRASIISLDIDTL